MNVLCSYRGYLDEVTARGVGGQGKDNGRRRSRRDKHQSRFPSMSVFLPLKEKSMVQDAVGG